MEIVDNDHAHVLLFALDNQRREWPELCDVRLNVEGQTLPAHRCILSACSGYFRVLFTGRFSDSQREECALNDCSHQTATDVLNFFYTGKIRILPRNVEEILSVADYLCIERLKEYCVKFMCSNINEESCVFIKYLCEKFSLKELSEELTHYIAPRISGLLIQPDMLSLPCDFVKYLLNNENFNHVNEQTICNFLFKWVQKDVLNRKRYIKELYELVEVSYLPREYIQNKLIDPDLGIFRELSNERKRDLMEKSSDDLMGSSMELLICRSRSVTLGQEVQLLSYMPEDDTWHFLKTPQPHLLDGLESLIKHQDAIYFLVSKTEDMYGYMHHSQETKYFYKFDLLKCAWENLASPILVRGACRLVSHSNGIYVIDRNGLLEEYDIDTGHWGALTETPLFDNPNSTWYVLPMPLDRHIFVLRVFSSGYAYSYDQISYSIHKIDTVRRTHEKMGEIEACELELDEKEKIHAYVAQHNCITMKNELGQPTLRFDLVFREFTRIEPKTKTPSFISDVWGSVQAIGRVYFVGKSKMDCPSFMFYDFIRDRFKATTAPPTYLSGLMCYVTFPREVCQKLLEK